MAAKPIQPLVLDNVGVYGLNRQSSSSTLPPQWLTTADNMMLDERGRLTTRAGIKQISNNIGHAEATANPPVNIKIVKSLGEYYSASGNATIFAGAGTGIYKLDTATTPYTLALQTITGGTSKTNGNWQWQNFNNKFYGAQRANKPVTYDGTNWLDIEDVVGYSAPTGVTTFTPSTILGDFGRLWAADIGENRDVVYYSDLLIGHSFASPATPGGPGGGSLDLKKVWSGDTITALASFMGKLIIFGKKNIVIFQGPWDVNYAGVSTTFQLDEVIEGVGCIARDSLQLIGDDIVFLSASGVRSLGRTIQQDTMPLTDLSLAIKDEIRTQIISADMDTVKGQYDLSTGSYLLAFPDKNLVYVFDFKAMTPDGAPRVTTWNFERKKNPRCFLSTTGLLYVGLGAQNYEGKVASYDGYHDVDKEDVTATYSNQAACLLVGNQWDTTGSKCYEDVENTYEARFNTTWMDFQQPGISKFLKRFLGIWSGGKGTDVKLNWYRDYDINPSSASFTLDPTSRGRTYLYTKRPTTIGAPPLAGSTFYSCKEVTGVAPCLTGQTALAKYSPSFQPTEYKIPLSKAAKVVSIEIIQTVNGWKSALQNMTIWAKQGKIR